MLTLDEQIARLADHAEEASLAATDVVLIRADDHRRSPYGRRWLLAAAASVVAIGLAAIALVPWWVEPERPAATVPLVTSIAPQPSVPSTGLQVPAEDGGEGDYVGVGVIPELPFIGSSTRMLRVDVNGTESWASTEAAFTVYWQAG